MGIPYKGFKDFNCFAKARFSQTMLNVLDVPVCSTCRHSVDMGNGYSLCELSQEQHPSEKAQVKCEAFGLSVSYTELYKHLQTEIELCKAGKV